MTTITHERDPDGDTPCGADECFVTVTRTITVKERIIVDVPAGEAPNAYARELAEEIDAHGGHHWGGAGESWERDEGDPDEGTVHGYHTEIGSY